MSAKVGNDPHEDRYLEAFHRRGTIGVCDVERYPALGRPEISEGLPVFFLVLSVFTNAVVFGCGDHELKEPTYHAVSFLKNRSEVYVSRPRPSSPLVQLFTVHIMGYSLADTALVALISRYASPATQGRSMGLNQAAQSMSRVVSPVVRKFGRKSSFRRSKSTTMTDSVLVSL